MVVVDPTMSAAGTSASSAPEGSNAMGKDSFLTLLVTQLQNQDPLSPMEGSEFTAQLAQFSSLEQLQNVNDNLAYLQMFQASINSSQAVSLIGKEIEAAGNSIQLTEGNSSVLSYKLGENANTVTIKIYDSNNSLVKTIDIGSQDEGSQNITWDGTDRQGNKLSSGEYTFTVSASDVNGNSVEAATRVTGKVTGVTFQEGVTYVQIGDSKIPIGRIIKITEVGS